MTIEDLKAKWIPSKDAQKLLGMGARTWKNLYNRGEIPVFRKGNSVFVDIDDINAFLSKNKTNKNNPTC